MVKGINDLKFSSNVKEIETQYKLDAKYPKPNNHPYKKKSFLFWWILDFFVKKIKIKLKVKKLIIK